MTEQHLEFLSLNGGCTGLSESSLVKMPHCWKTHVTAQIIAGPKGGPGGYVPPEEAVSALKKTFFKHYMILRVYTVMHTYMKTDYPHNNSAERKCGRGCTDRAVSVTRTCK